MYTIFCGYTNLFITSVSSEDDALAYIIDNNAAVRVYDPLGKDITLDIYMEVELYWQEQLRNSVLA